MPSWEDDKSSAEFDVSGYKVNTTVEFYVDAGDIFAI